MVCDCIGTSLSFEKHSTQTTQVFVSIQPIDNSSSFHQIFSVASCSADQGLHANPSTGSTWTGQQAYSINSVLIVSSKWSLVNRGSWLIEVLDIQTP